MEAPGQQGATVGSGEGGRFHSKGPSFPVRFLGVLSVESEVLDSS